MKANSGHLEEGIKKRRKISYLERLQMSEVVKPDAHPGANTAVLPSPGASMLSRSSQALKLRLNARTLNGVKSNDGFPLRPQTSITSLHRDQSNQMSDKGMNPPVSPFTPRYPSRLRITGHSPLRAESKSRLSSPSSASSSRLSTSSLTRAASSSFENSEMSSPLSPHHYQQLNSKVSLVYSPSTPQIEASASQSFEHLKLATLKHDSLSVFPDGSTDLDSADNISKKDCKTVRASSTALSTLNMGANAMKNNVTIGPPSDKSIGEIQTGCFSQLITDGDNKQSFSKARQDITITEHPKWIPGKNDDDIKGKSKSNTLSSSETEDSLDWRCHMPTLSAVSQSVCWQFNTKGVPSMLSNDVIERSHKISQCLDIYSNHLGNFISLHRDSLSFLSGQASIVDQAHAGAVAASMLTSMSDKRKEDNYRNLRCEISEEQGNLKRLRTEHNALIAVQHQQMALIARLENQDA